MKAVLLTKQVPWPSDSGGRIREAQVAELFAERLGEAHVLAFGAPPPQHLMPAGVIVHAFARPDRIRGALRGRSVAVGRWHGGSLRERVRALLAESDHLHVGFSQMAVNAPDLDRIDSLDLHNVESDLLAQRARTHPAALLRPALALEARRLTAWERRLGRVRVVTCVSEPDRRRLAALGLGAVVAANGTELPGEVAPLGPQPDVVFVGTLDWAPNVEGLLWFDRAVWPLLRQRQPDARIRLVGRDPAPRVRALGGDGITVVGSVPSVAPWYGSSRLAICPLLTGGGSRLKILEALAHGRPVVSTSRGAEGLETLAGRGVVLADGARAFANAIADLLRDRVACQELGARGRAAVAEGWSWSATLAPLAAALDARRGRS